MKDLSKKPVLFMMPQWNVPSEVWMQRIIEILEDDIALIVSDNAEPYWRNKIPGFCMHSDHMRWWVRGWRAFRSKFGRDPLKISELVSIIRKHGINKALVNFATLAVQLKELWERTDIELFVHCHGFDIQFDGRSDCPPYLPLHASGYLTQIRALSERAKFIANSKCTSESLKEIGIPSDRIILKYYGVDVPTVYSKKINKNGIKILYLGRLIDFKGPDKVIKAFEIASDQGLDAELVIAGDGSLRNTCELLQRESKYRDRIQMLGAVSRGTAEELFKEADLYTAHHCLGALTNREEAFGVSVIEAMSAGVPVITGHSGGVVESVVHGKTGMLVEQNNIESHASAILRLAKDNELRLKMGKAGWKRAKEMFSSEQEKNQLTSILGV